MSHKRLAIEIHGAVQGVGFRPFVYRLATDLDLAGWVLNDTRGVFIEVEGEHDKLEGFRERLAKEPPPRAIIHSLDHAWLDPSGYERFEIRHSAAQGQKTVLVLPDIATCPDCLADVFDPTNRRYQYPFTNCTNCGPRFTIIEALPYDRPNTTMRHFALCPDCRREYENPLNRRFHAQPNACPVCGPHLEWQLENEQAPSAGTEALLAAVQALREGKIVAVKGLGGYHLMVDARQAEAVQRLRERKLRRDKPFALMARDLDHVRELCVVTPEAAALLTAPEAPIVLLPRLDEEGRRTKDGGGFVGNAQALPAASIKVAENVAPGNPYLGVMLPCTPLHHMLLRAFDAPLVATSGNLSDEPICINEQEAATRLGHIADSFLVHNRPITRHVDDSIATLLHGAPRLLRRARGYAPLPVLLRREVPCILAVGAHLKNTVALSVGRQVFISQHIGDLETPEALNAFERVIADFLRLYEATPVAIAHDLHPDYASTRYVRDLQNADRRLPDAGSQSISIIPVQHHHAHFAACLAEHGVDGPALGVTWDGTGYGHDGSIWGGEFLHGDMADSQRVAHLRTFRLPGGDAAVREPRRVALALLWELYGPAALERDDLAPVRSFRPAERRLLGQMLERNLHAVASSSAGRLFDGVAALVGLQQQVSFEGQAAMALEWIADTTHNDTYPIDLVTQNPTDAQTAPVVLDWRPTLAALLQDLRRGVPSSMIAARFHNSMVDAIVATAKQVNESRVALTGGCFQNRLLVEHTARRLEAEGFEVLLHRQVPPNDGGISLGQVATAAARMGMF